MDYIDKKIIFILQRQADLSLSEISKRVGLSQTPCWNRIRKLEEDGVIEKKVTIITTSNFKPRELYGEGLNRELFIPFIELIENKLKILEVDNKVDYRKKKLIIESRFFLKDKKNELTRFEELWEKLYEHNDSIFVINYQSEE